MASPNPGSSSNVLNGVAAVSVNDVWAVGEYVSSSSHANQTLTEHWNGTSWSVVTSPNVTAGDNVLTSVAAVSTGNVWAVGNAFDNTDSTSQTLIEHWNGASWSVVTSPNVSSTNYLSSVAVVSANDIWAVGDYYSSFTIYQTLTEHWNGTKWSVVTSPNVGSSSSLSGVAVASTNDVWTVGLSYNSSSFTYQTLTEHWNGTSWSVVASPNPGSTSNELYSVAAVSTSNVWTVGTTSSRTLIEHWNGTSWSVVASPNVLSNDVLFGVAAVSASNIRAVGEVSSNTGSLYQTLTLHWNGTKWSVVASPNPGSSTNILYGVAALSASDVWAVGEYGSPNILKTLIEFYC